MLVGLHLKFRFTLSTERSYTLRNERKSTLVKLSLSLLAHTSFNTVELKHSTVGTRRKTHLRAFNVALTCYQKYITFT